MTIKVSSPSEAFAAVASVVIAADSVGSLAERDMVIQHLKAIPGLADQDLKALLGKVTAHLCESLPTTESGAFTPAAVASVIAAVKPVLSAEQCGQAVHLAESTVTADGASETERALLDQLRAGLTG